MTSFDTPRFSVTRSPPPSPAPPSSDLPLVHRCPSAIFGMTPCLHLREEEEHGGWVGARERAHARYGHAGARQSSAQRRMFRISAVERSEMNPIDQGRCLHVWFRSSCGMTWGRKKRRNSKPSRWLCHFRHARRRWTSLCVSVWLMLTRHAVLPPFSWITWQSVGCKRDARPSQAPDLVPPGVAEHFARDDGTNHATRTASGVCQLDCVRRNTKRHQSSASTLSIFFRIRWRARARSGACHVLVE